MKPIIIHVSEVDIHLNGGMGRVEYYWRNAFEKSEFNFIHIGPKEIGEIKHKALFPLKAYLFFKSLKVKPVAFIIHEPAVTFFLNKNIPVFLESHGIERRAWENTVKEKNKVSIITKLLYPIWRLSQCDVGLKKATKLLLINSDDKHYAISRYRRVERDIFIFNNGVDLSFDSTFPKEFTIIFNGSWIERKGIGILTKAATYLYKQNMIIKYLLIGTGKSKNEVLKDWPKYLHNNVEVVSQFESNEENKYLDRASIVVLPSNFEGQPLSILQAMAAGKCCIATNCCGQKDFIIHGKTGLLFEPENVISFMSFIEACYNDSNLIKRIGNAAKTSMKNRDWKEVSNNLVSYVINNL